MIEAPSQALLMTLVVTALLLAAGMFPAGFAAIAVAAKTMLADEEGRKAALTNQILENDFAARRHAFPQGD